ncbi:MAG: RNA pseudouridine synthase [Christensenella sp.]|nr:RNA pseudouridine synthase [Christensenella sp.]
MKNFNYKELVVLYEDNQVIVVVKPQNVPSQADESKDMDMLTAVKKYLIDKYNKPGSAYVGLVHRLDRPTGGVMVFAKTSKAAERLSNQIKNGEFEKEYLCITCGVPKDKTGTLVNYLAKDEVNNKVSVVPMATEGAKKAILHYEVLESFGGFSLIKVKLETGRSHQIRVQLSFIGCPLFGDVKYGANEKSKGFNLALWATKLTFIHPVSKEKQTFMVYPPVEENPWKQFEINKEMQVGSIASSYAFHREAELIKDFLPDD